MDPILGEVALGVYAALLGGGGVMGYRKAGSRSSLFAGLGSAGMAVGSLLVALYQPTIGFWLGAVLAVMMLGLFTARLLKTRKVMPSGMLAFLSLCMAVLLIVLAAQPTGLGPQADQQGRTETGAAWPALGPAAAAAAVRGA